MSETQIAILETPTGSESNIPEVHSHSERCDGSRTSPDVQYEIMRRHKQDMPLTVIADQVGCDPRTVKAVIQNWGTAQHTLRLQAHRSQVVDCLILGMHSAAEKGKLDSILNLSHTLGITEPVKGQQQTNVAVQVNLHGGPEPVSLAKVVSQSEGVRNQASTDQGLICPIPLTDAVSNSQSMQGLEAQVNHNACVVSVTQEPPV